MGTKNNPGAHDCYAKADPDEPLFTLLARDPLSHGLVELWAHLRSGDIYSAVYVFGYLVAQVSKSATFDTGPKVEEAYRCADTMRAWHREHRG